MTLDETEAEAESLVEAVVLAKADAVAWAVTMAEALAATVAVALVEAVDMAGMCCRSCRQA